MQRAEAQAMQIQARSAFGRQFGPVAIDLGE